ncbi:MULTISPECIES: iron ABC transporter permease [unclassified Devosia]|uniref:ABC transporter permease n=1 Tax=unclassified Devosia TaxID=196773 RepID=UPI00145C8377|nr:MULTISPECIES: iron ABC transporter permease [unclassified Devosia]MBJ6988806.1 iron ABC transporter permease [Devosia sp. MC521]QMW63621.1 iron ABC transporter permease [Devosia sp. MC521]
MTARFDFWKIVSFATWAILALLLIIPVGSVLISSFVDRSGNTGLANYLAFVMEPRYQRAFLNTLVVGFGGLFGAMLLGSIMAFCISRFQIKGGKFVSLLAILALVSPPFIGAYSWIVLFGAGGVVRSWAREIGINMPPIYGLGGILIVFALKFYPFVYLMVSGALSNVNRSLEEAAEGLGLTPLQRTFKISFPLVLPALSAGGLLALIQSIADFGTPRLLGRGYNVLATEAYALYSAEVGSNMSMATTISVVLIMVSMAFVMIQRFMSRKNVYHGNMINKPIKIQLRGWRNWLAHFAVYFIGLCGAMPVIISVIYSLRKTNGPVFQDGFALQSYERIIFNLGDVVRNSLTFSAIAVALIVVAGTIIGVLVARRTSINTSLLDGAFMIPYVMPGIVIGIAYIAAFNTGPLVLTGTAAIIILSIFIRRLPYTVRTTSSALRQISPSLEEAAVSLGYSPFQAFLRVTVPLIVPGIIAGAMLSFVTAINELSSSLVLYVGSTITMPVRIYVLILDGDFGVAAAMSTILLLISGIAVYIAFRLMGKNEQALL